VTFLRGVVHGLWQAYYLSHFFTGHRGRGRGYAAMETRADAAPVRDRVENFMTLSLSCWLHVSAMIVWKVPSVLMSVLSWRPFPPSLHFHARQQSTRM
jgi:hypothetical protein